MKPADMVRNHNAYTELVEAMSASTDAEIAEYNNLAGITEANFNGLIAPPREEVLPLNDVRAQGAYTPEHIYAPIALGPFEVHGQDQEVFAQPEVSAVRDGSIAYSLSLWAPFDPGQARNAHLYARNATLIGRASFDLGLQPSRGALSNLYEFAELLQSVAKAAKRDGHPDTNYQIYLHDFELHEDE